MSAAAFLTAGALVVSVLLTGWIRQYALSHEVLDVPNERSLHSSPTPRGGGLAILVVAILGFGVLWAAGAPTRTVMVLFGGVPVGIIGWVDDHRRTSPWLRIVVHGASALWAVLWAGGLSTLRLGEVALPVGMLGSVGALLGIVWCINLYNFMDGIDGIAAGEAVVVAGFGAALLFVSGSMWLSIAAAILCAASAGFLWWNWQPARIFMGDVGSGFLGYEFAVLALLAERSGSVPLLIWVLLAAVFVVDATVTLLRRVIHGERWYVAHKSHAYQRMVQSGWSHARTSTAVMAAGCVLGLLAIGGLHDRQHLLVYCAAGVSVTLVMYYAVERRRPMVRASVSGSVNSSAGAEVHGATPADTSARVR